MRDRRASSVVRATVRTAESVAGRPLGVSLIFLGLLIAAGIGARPVRGEAPGAEAWVSALGGPTYGRREEAMARLRALGHRARSAVRGGLAHSDPEVRHRCGELWRSLRWQVAPGIDGTTMVFLEALSRGEKTGDTWHGVIERQQATTLLLIAELGRERAAATACREGMQLLVERVPSSELVGVVAGQEEVGREALIEVVSLLRPDTVDGQSALRVVDLYTGMARHDLAFRYARDAWIRGRAPALLDRCARVVERGDLRKGLWSRARAEIREAPDGPGQCWRLAFYVALGRRLDMSKSVSNLVKHVDISDCERAARHALASELVDAELYDDALRRLQGSRENLARYLRSVAYRGKGEEKRAQQAWDAALEGLARVEAGERESACYGLADFMDRRSDPRAEIVWRMILTLMPEDSVYDANACLRLARWAERREEYETAVTLYDRGVRLAEEIGGVLAGASEKEMREHIKELRARE